MRARSREIGVPMCIAVTDESGHLIKFERMNGGKISSISIAMDKASTAAVARKGTHEYNKFIKPSELENWIRAADLSLRELTGMSYNPLTQRYSLGYDVNVNYLVHCQREAD